MFCQHLETRGLAWFFIWSLSRQLCFLFSFSSFLFFFDFYSCLPLLSSNYGTKQKQTRKRNPSLVQGSILSLWCRACHEPLCSAPGWGKWPKFAPKWRQFLPKRNSGAKYSNIKHLTPLHSQWETNLFFQFPLSCSCGWSLHWGDLSGYILTPMVVVFFLRDQYLVFLPLFSLPSPLRWG